MRALRRIPWWVWVLLVVLFVPGGVAVGVVALTLSEQNRKVRTAARREALRVGMRPELLDAVAYVESRWRPGLVNKSGPDGARGGSWGPFQLSEKTARAYGYTGPMESIRDDVDLAARWAAFIMSKRPGGPPATPDDVAAWWNAGHVTMAQVSAGSSARTTYLPALRDALDKVAASPLGVA